MRLANIGIGTKILLVVGIVFILFALGLAAMIGATSFNNLTQVKTAELERTSQILASQIEQMERNAALAARRFEESEPIVSELQLLTALGPYYADPASYFEADFLANGGEIDNADKVYLFQAQLELIQLLLSTQQLNNFSSIRFYLLSPFEVVPNAEPILALDLGQETLTVSQFNRKGMPEAPRFFSIAADDFVPPAPNYFGISSAYSFPADDFYSENNFRPAPSEELKINLGRNSAEQDWQMVEEPHSEIIVEEQVPILQTWYPVRVPMAHPETWEEGLVPIGIVQITQQLDDGAMALLAEQFGLDIGLARDNQLLITSLDEQAVSSQDSTVLSPVLLGRDGEPLTLNERAFNYAWKPVSFANGSANLQAVVLSSVSELAGLTDSLRRQIVQLAILTVLLAGILIYLSLLYLLNRPLGALMDGVQRISRGDLNHAVTTGSADEVGQLAMAFNGMASQVRDLVGSLEQRVADRTQELTEANQAAEVARRRAEMANLAKSEFLSHMSHELRTPLNGILGYTQILRKQRARVLRKELNGEGANGGEVNGGEIIAWNKQDLEQQNHGLNIIQQSGQHLLTLINDILDMAKIEAQKMELFPSDIDVADFLESLVNIFRFRAEQKGLRFVYEAPSNLPYIIHVDEKRLRQIIINLLSNAIRYTESGEVIFRVKLTELSTDVEHSSTLLDDAAQKLLLHCEIEDTGVGMTEQEIRDIFRPFEQSGDLVQRDKGTGLGLTISQNLAQIMGSQIAVQSVPGQGSKFWFDLTVQGNVNHSPLLTLPEQIVCGYVGPRRTILTVDDNQNNRSLIRDLLTPLGFKILDASSGSEAVALTTAFQPDLVLMDLRMTGINGLETTRLLRNQLSTHIRNSFVPHLKEQRWDKTILGNYMEPENSIAQNVLQNAGNQDLIIIAASASAFESDREESLQAGCDGFLAKPVQMAELFDLLQTHLDLEWIYAVGEDEIELSTVPNVGSIYEETPILVAPPPADLAELLNLAQRGMMRGIRDKAAQMADADARYEPFADEISTLALNFREKDLLALIQRYSGVTG